jgi:iron complex transport system ATP-binding protein
MTAPSHDWQLTAVSYGYSAERLAVRDVSLAMRAGTLTALVGPNGAGKSTVLALLLGHLVPTAGSVTFGSREVSAWPRRALARQVGVVPQHETPAFALTVREVVAMGRYPHLGLLAAEQDDDRAAIERALARCNLLALRDRPMDALSGGEQQRARLARAMAQEPAAYVLDEPTAGLDCAHEMALFEHARTLCAGGATVVLVTHHVNLAARYADRVALLSAGSLLAAGPPRDVLTAERCSGVFQWPITIHPHPGAGHDAGAPQLVPLARSGAPTRASLS